MELQLINQINFFEQDITKAKIKSMADYAIESILENGGCLEVAQAISAMQEFIETVKKDERFKDYVRDEAGKYPKGFISPSGAKVELAEVGTKYDFTKCNDIEWTCYNADLDILKLKIKTREDFLKTVPVEGMDIVTGDGEVIRIYPPVKTSTSSFKVTLAK